MQAGERTQWADRLLWPVSAAVALLVVWGIWTPYSFWLDEIFSVVAASESIADMFTRWVLIDVHPPLYQLLLNVWLQVFGADEPGARSLSLLSALLVVLGGLHLARRRRDLTGYVLMLLVMPWFCYNAQEARSYLLVYLFAFTALSGQLLGRHGLFLASLVLMAWTHYFGLFLAMSLLFVHMLLNWRWRRGEWLTALLMLSWLPVHLSWGSLLENADGGFWIQVSGPGETIANLFSAISPAFQQAWRLVPGVAWLYALLLVGWLGYFPWRQWRQGDVDKLDLQLSLSMALFVAGIIVVDQIVPMSTQRNFLVAMPAMIFLLYRSIRQLAGERGWTFLLCAWLLVQLAAGVVLMQHRQGEIENYRRTTLAAIAALDAGARGYYLDACADDRVYHSDALNNYYMRRLDHQGRSLQRLCRRDLSTLSGPVVVLACHQMPFPDLVARLPGRFSARAMDDKGLCALILPRSERS